MSDLLLQCERGQLVQQDVVFGGDGGQTGGAGQEEAVRQAALAPLFLRTSLLVTVRGRGAQRGGLCEQAAGGAGLPQPQHA